MKLIAYSFTDKGSELGEKISDIDKYEIIHIRNKDLVGGVKKDLEKSYNEYDGVIFISATGIAIRFIHPYIKDKHKDLPIIVVDDMGKFSISLLSGHLGGANTIAEEISDFIGAIPVITTASDNRGFQALDSFAKDNNYYIEDKKDLTKIMALMVNGKRIGLFSDKEVNIDYPNIKRVKQVDKLDNIEALIIIDEANVDELSINLPYIELKTRDIHIGIGCKKGIEERRIIKAIKNELDNLDISTSRIRAMATVEVKKDEKGIIETARYFSCPLEIFSIEEIKKVEDKFQKSEFVKKTIGVYSVSEPAAYLLGGQLLVKKAKHNGITISISKE